MSHPITRRAALERLSWIVGGTLSAPLASGLLAGCRAAPDPAYTPHALSPAQYDLTGALADVILPPTDTPGARDAGVPAFIDTLMAAWYPDEDRERFRRDLDRVDALAQDTFGRPFVDLTADEQARVAAFLDAEAFGTPAETERDQAEAAGTQQGSDELRRIRERQLADDDPEGLPFFRQMKELVLAGYYTSEVGATQELRQNPMGTYRGDVPFAEIGRAWA